MTSPDNERSSGYLSIVEGTVKKGGINKPPTTTRPAQPVGQGGSDSTSHRLFRQRRVGDERHN